jgi:DNA-binding CsgD family transcriptional regulator
MPAGDARALGPNWLKPPRGLAVEPRPSAESGVIVLSFPLQGDGPTYPPLTRSEEAVLDALFSGYTNAEISERRGVSVRTVANQIGAIFRKLGVHSRLDAARVAAECARRKPAPAVPNSGRGDSSIAQVSELSDKRA